MDYMSYSIEFGKLRYVFVLIHHTIDTCSEFQCTFALNSKNDDSEIAYLLGIMALLKMLFLIEMMLQICIH